MESKHERLLGPSGHLHQVSLEPIENKYIMLWFLADL